MTGYLHIELQVLARRKRGIVSASVENGFFPHQRRASVAYQILTTHLMEDPAFRWKSGTSDNETVEVDADKPGVDETDIVSARYSRNLLLYFRRQPKIIRIHGRYVFAAGFGNRSVSRCCHTAILLFDKSHPKIFWIWPFDDF